MALSKSSSAAPTKMRLHTTAAPMERKDETRVKGFDLPPGAGRGTDDKGHVSLTVDGLEWQLRGAPPWVRVTARWWGDELSDKRTRPWAKLVDGPGASASMTFPVKAKPAGFSRYCRDARAVVLEVGSIHARPTRLAPDSKSASLQTSRHLAPASPTRAHRPRILPLILPPVFRRAHREAHRQRQRRRLPPRSPPPRDPPRGAAHHQGGRRSRVRAASSASSTTSPARCHPSSSTSTSARWTIPSPWRRRRRYARRRLGGRSERRRLSR